MTIILENICKEYNQKVVLNDFYVEIEWDKIYGFTGPEGSGKSTILKIFMGTETPDKGAVHRMGDYKYPTLQSAYVSQEGSMNPKKNAIWNVKKAHRWASKKGVIESISKFVPSDRQNIPVSELNNVELRFLEIVKALYVPADFIVLDEPFYGMNDEEYKMALDYILDQRGSRPLLIASRDEARLSFADRVIHLQ